MTLASQKGVSWAWEEHPAVTSIVFLLIALAIMVLRAVPIKTEKRKIPGSCHAGWCLLFITFLFIAVVSWLAVIYSNQK